MEAANPLKASLADNASLLNNKAEGSLSVARAAVADSLTSAAQKSLINAVLSSGKVVADDLSSELWEKIKNSSLSTRTGTNIMVIDTDWDDLATIYFSTPFEHGCATVHITNIRSVISLDNQGNPKVTSLWENNNGQPIERWIAPRTRVAGKDVLNGTYFQPEFGKNLVCFDYIAYGK